MGCSSSQQEVLDDEERLSRISQVTDNPGKITEYYQIDKKSFASGSYGATVSKCRHKFTGTICAVKQIPKAQQEDLNNCKREINLMKLLEHPNILTLVECFEDLKCYHLILELCDGGNLLDRLVKVGFVTDTQAATLVKCMLQTVAYLHEQSTCHRDLKPDNFLLTTKGDLDTSTTLKLSDFGIARKFTKGEAMTTKCGTPAYLAPEVLDGNYSQRVDVWSIGVIAFLMLCGYLPFRGVDDAEILQKVRAGDYTFPIVSLGGQDLVSKLLKVNPRERPNAKRALKTHWIRSLGGSIEIERRGQQSTCSNKSRISLESAASSVCRYSLFEMSPEDSRSVHLRPMHSLVSETEESKSLTPLSPLPAPDSTDVGSTTI